MRPEKRVTELRFSTRGLLRSPMSCSENCHHIEGAARTLLLMVGGSVGAGRARLQVGQQTGRKAASGGQADHSRFGKKILTEQ